MPRCALPPPPPVEASPERPISTRAHSPALDRAIALRRATDRACVRVRPCVEALSTSRVTGDA